MSPKPLCSHSDSSSFLGCVRTGSDNSCDNRQNCRLSRASKFGVYVQEATIDKIVACRAHQNLVCTYRKRQRVRQSTKLSLVARVKIWCVHTGSDNACDNRQNCRLSHALKFGVFTQGATTRACVGASKTENILEDFGEKKTSESHYRCLL